jgi:hypothetical protein
MAAVFKRAETTWGGAFSANSVSVSFGTNVGDGNNNQQARLDVALMQNISLSYSQNVTRLFEIGTVNVGDGPKSRVYYVGGRAQGNLNIGRMIGPKAVLASYYEKYGDVCAADKNTLRLTFAAADCLGNNVAASAAGGAVAAAAAVAGTFIFTCQYCVLTQIGISLASEQFLVSESGQMMFSNFQYEGV